MGTFTGFSHKKHHKIDAVMRGNGSIHLFNHCSFALLRDGFAGWRGKIFKLLVMPEKDPLINPAVVVLLF